MPPFVQPGHRHQTDVFHQGTQFIAVADGFRDGFVLIGQRSFFQIFEKAVQPAGLNFGGIVRIIGINLRRINQFTSVGFKQRHIDGRRAAMRRAFGFGNEETVLRNDGKQTFMGFNRAEGFINFKPAAGFFQIRYQLLQSRPQIPMNISVIAHADFFINRTAGHVMHRSGIHQIHDKMRIDDFYQIFHIYIFFIILPDKYTTGRRRNQYYYHTENCNRHIILTN